MWRQLRPRPDRHAGTRALVGALHGGSTLGEALQVSAVILAKASVSDAAMRFEGGAVALFIVDVRDALKRQLLEAAVAVKDAPLAQALTGAAKAVDDEAFVGHLINTLLAATELYTETQPVERLPEARCTREVTALFQRSLCVLVSRGDAGRVCGERSRRVEFIPLPQPSRP
jgi:hypothetical protein